MDDALINALIGNSVMRNILTMNDMIAYNNNVTNNT